MKNLITAAVFSLTIFGLWALMNTQDTPTVKTKHSVDVPAAYVTPNPLPPLHLSGDAEEGPTSVAEDNGNRRADDSKEQQARRQLVCARTARLNRLADELATDKVPAWVLRGLLAGPGGQNLTRAVYNLQPDGSQRLAGEKDQDTSISLLMGFPLSRQTQIQEELRLSDKSLQGQVQSLRDHMTTLQKNRGWSLQVAIIALKHGEDNVLLCMETNALTEDLSAWAEACQLDGIAVTNAPKFLERAVASADQVESENCSEDL